MPLCREMVPWSIPTFKEKEDWVELKEDWKRKEREKKARDTWCYRNLLKNLPITHQNASILTPNAVPPLQLKIFMIPFLFLYNLIFLSLKELFK